MPQTYTHPILPSDQDALLAKTAQQTLEKNTSLNEVLHLHLGNAVLDLPPPMTRLLMEALTEMAAGKAVSLVSLETEIATQQAADILNVSRSYVVNLIEKGILPVRNVGTHRRLVLGDVLSYKEDNRTKRLAVLNELTAYDQELGL